ncbi:putative cytokinetic ring protein SteA [Brevibacillus ruminantium]|uniref:Cytokinetic ring protein SteA n=1 Tax=Brevibacillus ruminantium TaxID=2950604 RepID=A0ABY4W9C0_9BACL|nr:putative cytokinetic ring protein SteA [Brevibacillus ruminantium]USG63622.1 putative cytokinetic ring protein SteA [Brevibacillus ruminantium]
MGKKVWLGSVSHMAKIAADRKTKHLCSRIQPFEVAVVDHADLDEMAALSLLQANVRAVCNLSPFLTGTYPAEGAKRLLEAGIPLYEVQDQTPQMIDEVDGALGMVRKNELWIQTEDGWKRKARLSKVSEQELERRWQEASERLDEVLSTFIDNTLSYARAEKEWFLRPMKRPKLRTQMEDRHVVVVVRGRHYREDLRMLATYIRDYNPVLVAVDGGADALLENGYCPDLIIGDMDSISDEGLRSGAEIVVHAYSDGSAPGEERVEQLGLSYHLLPAPGTSEDIAMLLAYEENAKLIVTIGTHSTMIDFLEKGRKGMASTLLVRTKIGSRLIDAKGASLLYQPRWTWNGTGLLVAATLVPVMAALTIHPVARHTMQLWWMQWSSWAF